MEIQCETASNEAMKERADQVQMIRLGANELVAKKMVTYVKALIHLAASLKFLGRSCQPGILTLTTWFCST